MVRLTFNSLVMLKIDYHPRHLRLGVCVDSVEFDTYQDVEEVVPVVDDNGVLVERRKVLKHLLASDAMSKFKCADFKLSALVRNGVPLKMLNVNRSSSYTLSELENIANKLDGAERYVNQILAQKAEQRNWFSFNESESINNEL